jgi:hypothetical protein
LGTGAGSGGSNIELLSASPGYCLFSTTEKYGEMGRNEIFSLLAATMLLLPGIYKRGL